MKPILIKPDDRELLSVGQSTVALKATGDMTDGTLFLAETALEPGFPGPPLHHHEKLQDMFCVLEGTLVFRIGSETTEASAGTFVCIPPKGPHTFSNPSEEPVRFLNLNTLAGWEGYMRDLAEAARGDSLDPTSIGRIASNYDFVVEDSLPD